MKKLFIILFAFLVTSSIALAANTSTSIGNGSNGVNGIPVSVLGISPVYQYKVVIDTINTDLTLRTPSSNNTLCVLGWDTSVSSDTTLTFKYGASSTYIAYLLKSGTNKEDAISKSVHFCLPKGAPLIVRSDVAMTNLVVKVLESDYYTIQK